MKNIIALCILLAACSPDDATPTSPIGDTFDTTNATLLLQGTLVGAGGHTASGVASIYTLQNTMAVVLDPYESQNGPDLKVYLSKDAAASEYIRLGNLKSTMGKQSYVIPAGVDLSQYPYVHVWCEQFTVVFAIAELK